MERCQKNIYSLMVTDGGKWHYIAVIRLSALVKDIISKHKQDFYHQGQYVINKI